MIDRRSLRRGALVWSVVGLAIALSAVSHVNPDARLLVAAASIALPAAAALAAVALAAHRDRAAGLLLLISVATPTYFAWVLNVPALFVGLALLLAPAVTIRSQPLRRRTEPVPGRR
jgi:hypothetical protein